eukprot:scaffold215595_cov68-Attheya_sp.AAC.3
MGGVRWLEGHSMARTRAKQYESSDNNGQREDEWMEIKYATSIISYVIAIVRPDRGYYSTSLTMIMHKFSDKH